MATTIERCKYQFTEQELKEKAEILARKLEETERKEDQKKEVQASLKAEIEMLVNETKVLGAHIRNKFEYRDVKCDVIYDYDKGKVFYIRTDTGEEHRARSMTPEERQQSLKIAEEGNNG